MVKKLSIPHVGDDLGKHIFHGNTQWYTHSEKQDIFSVLLPNKHWIYIAILLYLNYVEVKPVFKHISVYKVYSSFIHKDQQQKPSTFPSHLITILLSKKNRENIDLHRNVDDFWIHFIKWKEPDQIATYCVIACIWYFGKDRF